MQIGCLEKKIAIIIKWILLLLCCSFIKRSVVYNNYIFFLKYMLSFRKILTSIVSLCLLLINFCTDFKMVELNSWQLLNLLFLFNYVIV